MNIDQQFSQQGIGEMFFYKKNVTTLFRLYVLAGATRPNKFRDHIDSRSAEGYIADCFISDNGNMLVFECSEKGDVLPILLQGFAREFPTVPLMLETARFSSRPVLTEVRTSLIIEAGLHLRTHMVCESTTRYDLDEFWRNSRLGLIAEKPTLQSCQYDLWIDSHGTGIPVILDHYKAGSAPEVGYV
jgi:hypothetical protein